MIALDTNLLVRIFLHDDEAQARTVERLLVRARRDRIQLFIADAVLMELAWVLARRAKRSRTQIADDLTWLLDVESVVVSNPAVARGALASYRAGSGDFANYIIREQALAAGAAEVVTFDRAVKGEAGFRVLR